MENFRKFMILHKVEFAREFRKAYNQNDLKTNLIDTFADFWDGLYFADGDAEDVYLVEHPEEIFKLLTLWKAKSIVGLKISKFELNEEQAKHLILNQTLDIRPIEVQYFTLNAVTNEFEKFILSSFL